MEFDNIDAATVGKYVAIGAGIFLLASAAYAVYLRAVVADANEDGKVTRAEYDTAVENGLPVLAPVANVIMTILSLVWKFDEETGAEE